MLKIKMKKSWKDRSAVSPVIATILMVAITVVLAAVLYVMVMGFGGDEQSSITGGFTSTSKQGTTQQKIAFGTFTPAINPDKIKIVVESNTTGKLAGTYDYKDGGYGSNITYNDLNKDDKIAAGDYILITPDKDVKATYTVTILNANSGASIDKISFNW